MWFLIPIAFVAAWILIPSKEGKGSNETLADSGVDVGSGDCRTDSRGENPPQKADGLKKENPAAKPIEVNREEFLKAEKGVVTAATEKPEEKESKNAADIGSSTTEP